MNVCQSQNKHVLSKYVDMYDIFQVVLVVSNFNTAFQIMNLGIKQHFDICCGHFCVHGESIIRY